MSANDGQGVRDSSNHHAGRREDALIQPFRQGPTFIGCDAFQNESQDSSAPCLLRTLQLGDSISPPVTVTEYIVKFCSFPYALRLTTIRHGRDRPDFVLCTLICMS